MSKREKKASHSPKGRQSVYNFHHPATAKPMKAERIPEHFVPVEVCITIDQPQEVALWFKWRKEWGDKVRIGRSSGCGCCVGIFAFFATPESIPELAAGEILLQTA